MTEQVRTRSGAVSRPGVPGVWIALFSSAVFGISGSFASSLLEAGWSSGAAVAARMFGAFLVLLVPAVLTLRGRWRSVPANWKPILLFGVFGVGVCQFAFFQAVGRLSVGVALLLEFMAPVLIVLVLWANSRRMPKPLTIIGTLLSLGGLMLVLDLAGAQTIDFIGVLWGLGAAVGLAVYFFVTAKANE
ncbi:MAG: DMT family transporter, partial [Micrococcaceae bacterium]|nr:DMT family transporter [Micrococcaceae bacterium]